MNWQLEYDCGEWDRLAQYIDVQINGECADEAAAYMAAAIEYQSGGVAPNSAWTAERRLRRALARNMPDDISDTWTPTQFAECDLSRPVGCEFWVERSDG